MSKDTLTRAFNSYTCATAFMRALLCCLALVALPLQAAQLSVDAQRQSISRNDQLVVTFQLRGAQQEPDFSPLQRDFEILGNYRSQQTRIINNRSDSFYEWKLTLAPKRKGQLTIPAISVAGARSDPMTIEVTEAPASPSEADVFLEVNADKDSVYVQQQLLVTAKLYSKYDWRGKKIQDFELDNAKVEAVDENEYVTELNGTPHVVYELTLAVFPQQSGTFTLPALQYAAELQTNRRSLLGNGPVRRGRSQPLTIDVKPAPDPQTDPWLPAQSVALEEHWSHDLQSLTAGEPVTRRITLKAEGLAKSQLPPIEMPDVDGFSSYRDQAQTQEQRSAEKGITSTRTETIAVVPNRAGRFTLPPVEIHWLNTQTGQRETAHLPARTVRVALPPGGRQPTPEQDQPAAGQSVKPYNGDKTQVVTQIPLWLWITQALTALVLIVLAVLYGRARRALPKRRFTHSERDVNTWKALKRAAAKHDHTQLRRHLLAWASQHWNTHINRLDAIAERSGDATLADYLRQLDASIYAPHRGAEVKPGKILQHIQALRVAKRDNQQTDLPTL